MLNELLTWWNVNAGPAASFGGLLGGLVGSWAASRAAVRRKWRAEVREELQEHRRTCPGAEGAAHGAA